MSRVKRVPTDVCRRFSELDMDAINVEHHVHTNYTDGQGSIEEVLTEASRRGIGSLAFTEHVRRDSDWFVGFADEVREVAGRFRGIRVLVGCEAKVLDPDGDLDVSDQILSEVDLVLGSVHRVPNGRGGFVDYRSITPSQCADLEYEYALALSRSDEIDVLAHPGGMTQRVHGAFPADYFEALMIETLKNGVAIEISSSYLRDPDRFLEMCRRVDPVVSIGSDVHRLETIGACRDLIGPYVERSG